MITDAELNAIAEQAAQDELVKDRLHFTYASDVLQDPHIVFPNAIWNEPNSLVREIILEGRSYDNRPFDEDNELHKGITFQDQADFIARHPGRQALCEALS